MFPLKGMILDFGECPLLVGLVWEIIDFTNQAQINFLRKMFSPESDFLHLDFLTEILSVMFFSIILSGTLKMEFLILFRMRAPEKEGSLRRPKLAVPSLGLHFSRALLAPQ